MIMRKSASFITALLILARLAARDAELQRRGDKNSLLARTGRMFRGAERRDRQRRDNSVQRYEGRFRSTSVSVEFLFLYKLK